MSREPMVLPTKTYVNNRDKTEAEIWSYLSAVQCGQRVAPKSFHQFQLPQHQSTASLWHQPDERYRQSIKSKLRRTELTQQTSCHMCLPKSHFAHDLWNPLSCRGLPTHLEPHSCHHKKSAHIVELAEPHARRHDLQSYWSAHTTKTATWATKDKLQFQNIIDCTTRQRGPFKTLRGDILSKYK